MFNQRISMATRILVALGIGRMMTMIPPKESLGIGGYRKSGGGSVKAGQRAAAKRRNINRNRNAHKGR